MNEFGTTSPCAKIAAHFKVPQGFVDAAMEFKLVERGIRTRNNWPTHTHLYWRGGNNPGLDVGMAVHSALDKVCKDILAAAGK